MFSVFSLEKLPTFSE